jgi:hypothetical protein
MAISLGDLGGQISAGLADVGMKTAQAAMIAGGLFLAFFLTPTEISGRSKRSSNILFMGGLGMAAVGGAWWLSDSAKATKPPVAKMAGVEPTMIYNPIETRSFTNPVNNLAAVPPRNRFDKQSNYIMNPSSTADTYLNNLIISEAKGLGYGNIGNYPVRLQPYQVKSLNPTTQVEPSRDTNTVKMLA